MSVIRHRDENSYDPIRLTIRLGTGDKSHSCSKTVPEKTHSYSDLSKDAMIKLLGEKLAKYKKLYTEEKDSQFDLKKQVQKLTENNKHIVEAQGKGIKDYITTTDKKIHDLEKEISDLLTFKDKLRNEFEEKIKMNANQQIVYKNKEQKWIEKRKKLDKEYKEKVVEVKKSHEKVIAGMRRDLLEEMKLSEEQLSKSEQRIKELIQMNNGLKEDVKKYKKSSSNECHLNCKSKLDQLRTAYKEKEQELRRCKSTQQQRNYFQTQNESHKRKWMSSQFDNAQHKAMYAKKVRKMGKIANDSITELTTKVIELIKDVSKEQLVENYAKLAETVLESRDESLKIQSGADKIMEKRADGRVNCGYKGCDKSFATTGDLKHHFTITHKMSVNNSTVSANHEINFEEEVITIKDDD